MTHEELIALGNKLKQLISFVYERYKTVMTDEEISVCEEYLYEQGEYELALDNLFAILKTHKIELDSESANKMEEAKRIIS